MASGAGVFGQRFSSAGVAQAVEFQVNTYITSLQFNASVADDADGDFVVAWPSRAQDGANDRRVRPALPELGSSSGRRVPGQLLHPRQPDRPSVATDADGDFVVAWDSRNQDGAGYGVFARRFSSAGASQAVEFQVNVATNEDQQHPSVISEADGDFVVAWDSRNQDGDSFGIFARRFSSAGAPQADEFQVNTYTVSHQMYPSVALTTDGGFVVAWQSYLQVSGGGFDIFARPFSSTGTPLASEFQVNLHTAADQSFPAVATDADGDFVVVWQSAGPGRFRPRRLRSSLLERGLSFEQRVPGQQLHPERPVLPGVGIPDRR